MTNERLRETRHGGARDAEVGWGLGSAALLLCAVGLFALGAAVGWVPIGVTDRPSWIRVGVAIMGLIGVGGGGLVLSMLLLVRRIPARVSDSGIFLPAWRFILADTTRGEFIGKRDIVTLEIREEDLELKVRLRTTSGKVKVFGCAKDLWEQLLALAPLPVD